MSLKYNDLVSLKLLTHAKKMISVEEEETNTYYLEEYTGKMYIDRYYQLNSEWIFNDNSILINSVGNENSDKSIIKNIFNKLDKIIDLDFKEVNHNNGSRIDIYSVLSSTSFSNDVVGQIFKQENQSGA